MAANMADMGANMADMGAKVVDLASQEVLVAAMVDMGATAEVTIITGMAVASFKD